MAGQDLYQVESNLDDGSANLERGLRGYTRVPVSDLCQSAITVFDPLKLSVFLHNGKKWTKLDDAAISRIWGSVGDRSFCTILKQNLFKLDERHLNSLKHSLQDENTADVIGLYKKPLDTYALVVRIPIHFKKEQLAAGLIGGGLGALVVPSMARVRKYKARTDVRGSAEDSSESGGYLLGDHPPNK